MPTIMAEHDVEGHLRVRIRIWSSPDFFELWAENWLYFRIDYTPWAGTEHA